MGHMGGTVKTKPEARVCVCGYIYMHIHNTVLGGGEMSKGLRATRNPRQKEPDNCGPGRASRGSEWP